MTAYYNEIDPFAAAWLRELIKAGHIAPGEVDTRSIADVMPSDLAGFTQCHFFAGIGVWSYALRQSGWADDRAVWTGSCPCQPFSSAGKGKGFKDERHLWPEFYRLISECRPTVCFGEQVASKDGLTWLDLVQADMEGSDYAFGAIDTCSASFGAPHIRQRLYWVGADTLGNAALWGCVRGEVGNEAGPQCTALGSRKNEGCGRDDVADDGACMRVAHTKHQGRDNWGLSYCRGNNNRDRGITTQKCDGELGRIRTDSCEDCNSPVRLELPCADNRMAHAESAGRANGEENIGSSRQISCAGKPLLGVGDCSATCGLADTKGTRWGILNAENVWPSNAQINASPDPSNSPINKQQRPSTELPGPTNGHWRDADWLFCRDGKWRAVEPGTFPLAHGATARVGRLRGYGNAINAEQAKAFIEAFMEVSA